MVTEKNAKTGGKGGLMAMGGTAGTDGGIAGVAEWLTQREEQLLGPYAARSADSRGRARPQAPSPMRTEYQRDRDRIIHCQAFRRLMNKTQVFLAPAGDHYRTRLTHTLEVSQIARTMARALRLNEDLTEAAALGHDLGHTPFGHAGEAALRACYDSRFAHYEQSLRVVDKLERDGAGLNLTYEVRMGILGHTGDFIPETLEGQIVRTSDRIAYINHDIDDAMRAGILTEDDIPPEIAEILGHSHSQRINTLVENMIDNTIATGTLGMQPEIAQAMDRLRTFMFARVYTNPVAKGEETKAKDMLCRLFEYYMRRPEKLPADFLPQLDFDGMERIVCDYIAGMTDRYAVYKYSELFIPTTWQVR